MRPGPGQAIVRARGAQFAQGLAEPVLFGACFGDTLPGLAGGFNIGLGLCDALAQVEGVGLARLDGMEEALCLAGAFQFQGKTRMFIGQSSVPGWVHGREPDVEEFQNTVSAGDRQFGGGCEFSGETRLRAGSGRKRSQPLALAGNRLVKAIDFGGQRGGGRLVDIKMTQLGLDARSHRLQFVGPSRHVLAGQGLAVQAILDPEAFRQVLEGALRIRLVSGIPFGLDEFELRGLQVLFECFLFLHGRFELGQVGLKFE